MPSANAGLDINESGQLMAIAAVKIERRDDGSGRKPVYRDILFLERLSKRPYDEAVRRVAEIVEDATRQTDGEQPSLYGNVTGAGKAVLGALRGNGVRAWMKAVYLTDGDKRPEGKETVRLGKGWLVCRLQERLATGRLRALDTARAGAEEVKEELLEYRPGDEPGPLMTALGLAVYKDWSGIGRPIPLGGPGSPNPYRNRRAERAVREWLDQSRWRHQLGGVD